MRAFRRTTTSRLAAAAVALTVATLAATAPADEPSAGDKALAETLFRAGRQLVDDGKTAEGCAKLEESYRLEAKVGTLLNVALCHEQLGKTATAWAEMIEVGSQTSRLKQDDRAAFAKERVAALEKKLSRLTISVAAPPAGLVVSLDGKALGASTLGVAVPLDPGEHRVEAKAPGKAPWVSVVTLAPGPATKTIDVPALPDGPATPAGTGTGAPTASGAPTATTTAGAPSGSGTSSAAPPPATGPNGLFVGGLIATGVGVAGLAVGGIFGGLTLSKEADADKVCPGRFCSSQEGLDLHDQAAGFATISTIGFAAGIVGAGAGITLLLLSSRSGPSKEKAASTWIAPAVGPTAAGFTAGGRF